MKRHRPLPFSWSPRPETIQHCDNCAAVRAVTCWGNCKGFWKLPDGTRAPWCQEKTEEQLA